MSNQDNDGKGEKYFAVFRNDFRVSNSEYPSATDAGALHEYNYWKRLLANWPDGSRLRISELKWRRKEPAPEETNT